MTRPTDLAPVERGELERVLSQHHVSSIAARLKAADRSARVASVAGHKCYAADAMATAAADYILCALIYHDRWVAQAVGAHRPPPGAINNPHFDYPIPPPNAGFAPAVEQWWLGGEDDWTTRYALWALHRIHYPRLLMINLAETDVACHFWGTSGRVPAVLMQHFDRELGEILDAYHKAGILNRTTFVVTADHGMTRVDQRSPFGVFNRAVKLAGATKVVLEADTAAALGITPLSKAKAVAVNVARLAGPVIDATYYKVDTKSGWQYRPAYVRSGLPYRLRQAYLTLADTAASASGPDVWTVYAPHVTTGDRIANGYHWLAGHLGPQWDEQHIPFIIAGAGVRHGVTSGYPARLVDIAPTLEWLMGAKWSGLDGSVLADALPHPPRLLQETQEQRGRGLTPLVQALQARSAGQGQ